MGQTDDSKRYTSPLARIIVGAVSTILVGLFLAGVSGGIIAWRNVAVIDNRITAVEVWKSEGGRYTSANGDAERAAREAADSSLSERLRSVESAMAACQLFREEQKSKTATLKAKVEQCFNDLARMEREKQGR